MTRKLESRSFLNNNPGMALTYSEMIPLGRPAKPFLLKDLDGKPFTLDSFRGAKATVFIWLCAHCPYVQAVQDRIAAVAREYSAKGVKFAAICSNDARTYPEDAPDRLREQAKTCGFTFPYLLDETQDIARDYGAVCTPDFFVFDSNLKLAYRGRLDDSWKNAEKVTKRELAASLDALLAGQKTESNQMPAMGCSIKWRLT